MIYAEAKLSHEGLCNRLFAWARCKIFCHINRVAMLEPVWGQFKLGPVLRREKDNRSYNNLFIRDTNNISGIKKKIIMMSTAVVPEPFQCAEIWAGDYGEKNVRVVFSGWKDFFEQLNSYHQWLYEEIEKITVLEWKRRVAAVEKFDVALHVRRGDFNTQLRTPLGWFTESLNLIRRESHRPLKALVFSDGSSSELQPLLDLKFVKFVEGGSALSDLLLMSQAKLLLASGSSFSAWAAFFGQMPAITSPGHDLKWFKLKNQAGCYVGEFNPQEPNTQILKQIKDRI